MTVKSQCSISADFTWASQLQPHAYTSPVLDKARMCSQPTAMSSMNTPSKAGIICGRLWFFSMASGRPIRRSVKTYTHIRAVLTSQRCFWKTHSQLYVQTSHFKNVNDATFTHKHIWMKIPWGTTLAKCVDVPIFCQNHWEMCSTSNLFDAFIAKRLHFLPTNRNAGQSANKQNPYSTLLFESLGSVGL